MIRRILAPLAESIVSLAIGILVVYVILLALNYNPVQVLSTLFIYGFNDVSYLLQRSTPLICTAFAFSIPLYAGLFNIGGEASVYLGAFASILASQFAPTPLTPIAVGLLSGIFIGWIIGYLKVRFNVNEVVSSIMVNWILYYIVLYLITNIFYNPSIPHQSIPLPAMARLPTIGSIPIGFIVAVLAAASAYVIVYGTSFGYRLRVVGYSNLTARYAGFNPEPVLVLSMVIGNAFAGLGGALLVQSVVPYIDSTMSAVFGLGFNGIGVALLGRLNPIGIVLASLLVSGMLIGGEMVELITGAPPEIVDTTIGIIIVSLALPYAYRMLVYMIRSRRVRIVGG